MAVAQSDKEKLFGQIANMVIAKVPQVEIAEVIGVDASRIAQIVALPDYLSYEAKVIATRAARAFDLNNSWDEIEQSAQTVIKHNLKWNQDADFALKAAAVANRAQRRGHRGCPLRFGRGRPRDSPISRNARRPTRDAREEFRS